MSVGHVAGEAAGAEGIGRVRIDAIRQRDRRRFVIGQFQRAAGDCLAAAGDGLVLTFEHVAA
ncbi:MAG: hypothetical protein ACOCX5_05515, partial [Chloroflexota bacterium]